MNKEKIIPSVDRESLQKAFDLSVPHGFTDVQAGGIYGTQNGEVFCLHQKKGPRSLRVLTNECLCFRMDFDGNLHYWYRRTWETVLMTLVAPGMMFLGGVLVGGVILKIPEMAIWGVLAVCLLGCNLIRSKALRSDLLDKLMWILEISEKQSGKFKTDLHQSY